MSLSATAKVIDVPAKPVVYTPAVTLLLMLLWSIFALALLVGAVYWSWRIWRAFRP